MVITDGQLIASHKRGSFEMSSHHGKAGWPSRPSSPSLPLTLPRTATATALSGDSFLPPSTPQLVSNLGKTANRRSTRLLTHAR